jgi:hypothetical protein
LNKLLTDNEEIRMNIARLLEQGIEINNNATITQTAIDTHTFNHKTATLTTNPANYGGMFRQPIPQPMFDGTIDRGVSRRFDNSRMDVSDKEGRPLDHNNTTHYDVALL